MINYILKEKKKGKKSAVSAIISGVFSSNSNSENRIKIALGVSVTPETFGTPANNYSYDSSHLATARDYDSNLLRTKISQFEEKTKIVLSTFLLTSKTPTKEDFENHLLGVLINDGIIIKKNYVNKYIHFLDDQIQTIINNEKNKIDSNTKKSDAMFKVYGTLLAHVINYQSYIGYRVVIEDIKVATILEIVDFTNKLAIGEISIPNNIIKSTKKIRNKEGYSINTINTLIANLKACLRKVDTDIIKVNVNLNDYRLKKLKSQNAKKLYFDCDILNKIYNHKPLCLRTQRAKDYFILASATGMRYQGIALLHNYKPQLITTKDSNSFYVVQNLSTKTGIELLSPLFAPAMEVYKRNGNKFPKTLYSTRLSEAMRELLGELGITHEVPINEWIHGKGIVSRMEPINSVVTSHDNRKTFVTNLKQLGVNGSIVRSMTHESIEDDSSSFNIYDNATAIDRAITFYEATKKLNTSIYRY